MDLDVLVSKLPMLAYMACSGGLLYLLLQYKRKNDLQAWLSALRASANKATSNEAFRQAELADTDRILADCPEPAEIVPLRRNQEMFLQILPKFLFVLGAAAVVVLFFGIFQPAPDGTANWTLYVGVGLVAMTGTLYFLCEKMLRDYRRVQQLNRKYILLKAGNDYPGMFAAIEEILKYFPTIPELWLEYSDRLAKVGRLEEAVKAIRKAREISPKSLDLAVVELSFLIRGDQLAEAGKLLETLGEMNPPETDPRPDTYACALALRKKQPQKAEGHARRAAKLDLPFIENFLFRDETLEDVQKLMGELGLLSPKKEEAAS